MINYVFEKMYDGGFQVRLEGFFVCYTKEKDPTKVDIFLKEHGFESRKDFLDFCYREYV